jgi:hypothetical protein
MRNTAYMGNTGLLNRALRLLRERLPPRWVVEDHQEPRGPRRGERLDALLDVFGPDGRKGTFVVEAKSQVAAAEAARIAARLDLTARDIKAAGTLLVTGYLTPLARERLAASGVSYLDLTGNARIVLDRPAMFIESRGADRDPAPRGREVRSLKGGSAARVVRALCDWTPPLGVRELARRTEVNAGYTTRVLSLLENEALITRDASGGIASVEWRNLLRRWTQDYAVTRTNRTMAYLEPRSVDALLRRLGEYKGTWALTGSRAIPRAAATAPRRTISCYVESAEQAAEDLGLRSVEAGANVILLEPFDAVVGARTRSESGLTCVAVSQCAADVMTGTGREPSEAEAFLAWMQEHEPAWRA